MLKGAGKPSEAQAEFLGLKIPDPALAWDEATKQYRFGNIDWSEFQNVLKGNGPCNRERIEARRKAHEEGTWVRDAALAYAAKQKARATAQAA